MKIIYVTKYLIDIEKIKIYKKFLEPIKHRKMKSKKYMSKNDWS